MRKLLTVLVLALFVFGAGLPSADAKGKRNKGIAGQQGKGAQAKFARLDTNNDGSISLAEYQAAKAAQAAKRQAKKNKN